MAQPPRHEDYTVALPVLAVGEALQHLHRALGLARKQERDRWAEASCEVRAALSDESARIETAIHQIEAAYAPVEAKRREDFDRFRRENRFRTTRAA